MTIGTRTARCYEDGALRGRYAEAGGKIRPVPDHHLLVAQHTVELRDETRRGVESLHRLVVAAVGGEAGALPSAERLAAEDEQRGAGAEVQTLLEQRVEDVDLRARALDRLHSGLQARRVGHRRRGRRDLLFEPFFELADRLL